MTCEFNPGGICGRNAVVCNSGPALQQMQVDTDLTLTDIRKIVCGSNDPGRDCPAYHDLKSYGRSSSWAKR